MSENYGNENEHEREIPAEETVHPEQAAATQEETPQPQPIEKIPAEPEKYRGSNAAGLQNIRQAINVLKTHSAAGIQGSIIGEALTLLEQGYSVLVENKV